jgi:hypothetical protein
MARSARSARLKPRSDLRPATSDLRAATSHWPVATRQRGRNVEPGGGEPGPMGATYEEREVKTLLAPRLRGSVVLEGGILSSVSVGPFRVGRIRRASRTAGQPEPTADASDLKRSPGRSSGGDAAIHLFGAFLGGSPWRSFGRSKSCRAHSRLGGRRRCDAPMAPRELRQGSIPYASCRVLEQPAVVVASGIAGLRHTSGRTDCRFSTWPTSRSAASAPPNAGHCPG